SSGTSRFLPITVICISPPASCAGDRALGRGADGRAVSQRRVIAPRVGCRAAGTSRDPCARGLARGGTGGTVPGRRATRAGSTGTGEPGVDVVSSVPAPDVTGAI